MEIEFPLRTFVRVKGERYIYRVAGVPAPDHTAFYTLAAHPHDDSCLVLPEHLQAVPDDEILRLVNRGH